MTASDWRTRGIGEVPADAVYLTTRETAALLGRGKRWISRQIAQGELPALHFGDRLIRVEAAAVRPAVFAEPVSIPNPIGVAWLAAHWRLHPDVVRRLALQRRIPMGVLGGTLCMFRRDYLHFVRTRTTGAR